MTQPPPTYYDFTGAPGTRLRDDHDGHPIVLKPGTGDNGPGSCLTLTGDDITALVDAGILVPEPDLTDALTDAFAAHVGDLEEGTVTDLGQLADVSPQTATAVHAVLTGEYPDGGTVNIVELRRLIRDKLDDTYRYPPGGTGVKTRLLDADETCRVLDAIEAALDGINATILRGS